MGAKRPRSLVLDAGALIGIERADRRLVRLMELAEDIHVPAGVVAQVLRNPARQVRLVRVLGSSPVQIHPMTFAVAQAAGHLCGAAGTADVIDASVVLLARTTGSVVVTSDPEDLLDIDRALEVAQC